MPQRVPPDLEEIIQELKLHGVEVEGPTEHNGEFVFQINEHTLTEREIRSLAEKGRLTSWEIYNYVRDRPPFFGR